MDNNDKQNAIELCIALKKMPHVFQKVRSVWGYPEFFETVDSMLLMEQGREGRGGFPEGVYKEIDALKRVFVKFPEQVMPEFLNDHDRQRVWEIIDEINARTAFTTERERP